MRSWCRPQLSFSESLTSRFSLIMSAGAQQNRNRKLNCGHLRLIHAEDWVGVWTKAAGPTGAAHGPTGAAAGPTGTAAGPTGAAAGPTGAQDAASVVSQEAIFTRVWRMCDALLL